MFVKLIRWLVVVVFILSVGIYAGVTLYTRYTTDSAGPKITMEETEITVSVYDDESAILAGITAIDATDGDVTDSLMVESMSNFITTGVRDVTIVAHDSAGNVTKRTRRITYSDYTSPQVTLTGPLAASTSGTSALLDVIEVFDCLDGDISDQVQIVFEDTTQSAAAGEFPMRIQVSNSAGDTVDMPVTVRFYTTTEESNRPQLALTDYLIRVKVGTYVTPMNYLSSISIRNTLYTWDASAKAFYTASGSGQIFYTQLSVSSEVDYSTPGTYEIAYTYTDADSGTVGTVRLVVVVEEG